MNALSCRHRGGDRVAPSMLMLLLPPFQCAGKTVEDVVTFSAKIAAYCTYPPNKADFAHRLRGEDGRIIAAREKATR